MPTTVLARADLSLFSDPNRRVELPRVSALAPSRAYAGAEVRFAGDRLPTPFRGEGRDRTWNVTVLYTQYEHQALLDLLTLIEEAAEAPDSRLFLRTHTGQIGGLDAAEAVVIRQVDTPSQVGLMYSVTFTCKAVAYSLEG